MDVAPQRWSGLLALIAAHLLLAQAGLARDSDAAIGEVTFDGAEALLPLHANEVHACVTATLGNGKRYHFLVDTGAPINMIDATIAAELGYAVLGETEIGAPGGPEIPASIVSVPRVQIGDVTVTDAEFVTMDMLGLTGGRTHGVLGIAMFNDYLVSFDRGAAEIKLSPGSLLAGQPGVLAYRPVDGQLEVDMVVAGIAVVAHVDTGSTGEFTLPAELMASLPLAEAGSVMKAQLVGGERDIQFAELRGSVEFAGLKFDNPQIAFMSSSSGHGNIGSGIFADYILSIDQKNHLIALQQPAAAEVATKPAQPRRLGVQAKGRPGGNEFTIAAVKRGSLAEQAGLRADDIIVSVNGKAIAQYDTTELGALFGGSDALRFDILRDGQPVSITIP